MTVTTRRRALLERPGKKKNGKEALKPLPQVPPSIDHHPKIETPLIPQQPPPHLGDHSLFSSDAIFESVLDLLKRQPHVKFSIKQMIEEVGPIKKSIMIGLPSKMNLFWKKNGNSLLDDKFKLCREYGEGDHKGKWMYWMMEEKQDVAGVTTIDRHPTPIQEPISDKISETDEQEFVKTESEQEISAPPPPPPPLLSPPLEIKDDESTHTSGPLSPVSPPQQTTTQCTVDELVHRPCNDWGWVWGDADMTEVYHPPEEITLMELDEMLQNGF